MESASDVETRPEGAYAYDIARRAIASEPSVVRIVHQPVVSLEDGTVVGWEALSRFSAPVPTEQVFVCASELGLGSRLEASSLALALGDVPRLGDGLWLSVNLSPVYLGDPDVEEVLASCRLDHVVLELTEHVPVASVETVRTSVDALRARGARVAIDDAGSGYGGLALAHALAPEFVKVDRSLVAWIDHNDTKLAVLETLVATAHEIGAAVVAEGVERPEELAVLARIGVDLAQGFLLSRPRPGFPMVPQSHLVGHVRRERRVRFGRELAMIVDPVRTVSSTSGLEDGALAVLVDQRGRPLVLVDWVAGHGRVMRPATELPTGGSLDACLAAGFSRNADERAYPLVVVDDQHRVLGMVRIERAIAMAARRGVCA